MIVNTPCLIDFFLLEVVEKVKYVPYISQLIFNGGLRFNVHKFP